MEYLFQIALIALPAGAVIFTAVLFMRKTNEREMLALNIQLKKERQEFFLPNRVEAYQRSILFLESLVFTKYLIKWIIFVGLSNCYFL